MNNPAVKTRFASVLNMDLVDAVKAKLDAQYRLSLVLHHVDLVCLVPNADEWPSVHFAVLSWTRGMGGENRDHEDNGLAVVHALVHGELFAQVIVPEFEQRRAAPSMVSGTEVLW